jgi:polysaccharide biosynthesis protein PslG
MRRTVGLAGLLILLALVLPAAGAQALPRTFWGVVDTSSITTRDLNKMRRSGTGVVRVALYRAEIGPNGGSFNWGASDQIIGGLASRGIATLPELLVSQSNPPPPISGNARQEWEQFSRKVAARYKPGGDYWSGPYQAQFGSGAHVKAVRSFQVFNEPNLKKYFPSNTPVKDYAKLLKITHDAIHSAYAHANVVLAGLAGFSSYRGWKFLHRLYRVNGVKRSFDIAAIHPYSISLYYLRYQLKKFRGVMRKHGDKRTPVWITEFGFGSAHSNGGLNKGLHGQAHMLKKSFKYLRGTRKRWHLRGVAWFQWRDPPQHNPDCSFCSSAGLLRANYRAKPALHAFKHFAR